MQNNKPVLIVRVVAIFIMAMALYSLPDLLNFIWLEWSYSAHHDVMSDMYIWNLLWTVWFTLLCILKMITAYGLFQIRPWAWILAMVVFPAEFLSRVYGIFSLPGEPVSLNQNEGVIVESFHIWPFYFHALILLFFLFVLVQKPIIKLFKLNKGLKGF